MTAILYMAISADGFIADDNDQTPWSDSAWKSFNDFVVSCDAVLLGRRTYEIMQASNEFIQGPEYIVATNDNSFNINDLRTISVTNKNDLPKMQKLGIIGGGELNGSLARLDAIDEIILDVEPITLGSGKRLFGASNIHFDLELIESKRIGDSTIQNHYLVKRKIARIKK